MSGVSLGHAAATGRCFVKAGERTLLRCEGGQRSGGPSRFHRRSKSRSTMVSISSPTRIHPSSGTTSSLSREDRSKRRSGTHDGDHLWSGRPQTAELPLGVDHVPAKADDRPLLLDRHYSRLGADRGPRHRVRRSARRLRRDAERRTRTRAPKFGGTALAVALRTACRCLAVGSEGDSPLQPGPSPAASLKPCWRAA
jgi:hypothetical protein